MEKQITIQDLRNKRNELQLLCRFKTGGIAMKDIVEQFTAQDNVTKEEKVEAQIQYAKYLGYMGDLYESEAIIRTLHASMDDTYPEKLRAKIWFQFVLEEKRSLVFHTCID